MEPATERSGDKVRITVSRPINGIGVNGDEYLLGVDDKPLRFISIEEMLRFLEGRNFTLKELLGFNFDIEEE